MAFSCRTPTAQQQRTDPLLEVHLVLSEGLLFHHTTTLGAKLRPSLHETPSLTCLSSLLQFVAFFINWACNSERMNSFSFDFSFLEEGFTARDILEQKINAVSFSDDKDAFYVADLGDIVKKHIQWNKLLPRVTPFYAVKCNDSKAVVKTIAILGAGFDCASKAEIQLVQNIGVQPERIIYANPCKQISEIKYAASCGVGKMTFDSEGELMKVAKNHPNAKLVLRIVTDDSKAECPLSMKFGATLKTSRLLLERAKELNIDVIGVSFHVGSGSRDPQTFVQAISDARCVFDMGAELGFNIHLLDIGGGFPGSKNFMPKFEE
ncbi:hypothetical protein AB205_0124140, partial [Aquarana catesbeiana]